MGSLKLSSADLQRILFGQEHTVTEQNLSLEPTPPKRLKSSSNIDEDDEVSSEEIDDYFHRVNLIANQTFISVIL